MAGTSASGAAVDVDDNVSIAGEVIAVSGSGQKATVTVKLANGTTFNVQAGDCFAAQGVGAAVTENGKPFGVGSQVTVKGVVQVVSGSGSNANLTVKVNSGVTPPVIPAPSAHAPRKH